MGVESTQNIHPPGTSHRSIVTSQPVTGNSSSASGGTSEPGTGLPGTRQPGKFISSQPGIVLPDTRQPVNGQPVTSQPGTGQLITGHLIPGTSPGTCHRVGLSGSVGCTSDWRTGGRGLDPLGNILSWRLIMKYFLQSFRPFC